MKKISREAAGSGKKANKAGLQAKHKTKGVVTPASTEPCTAPVDHSEAQPPPTPQPISESSIYEPHIVQTVTHRKYDDFNRRLGHHGMVQRRHPAKIAKFGGKEFAAWAVLTKDDVPASFSPERFETFALEEEAIAHAKYAAGRTPK